MQLSKKSKEFILNLNTYTTNMLLLPSMIISFIIYYNSVSLVGNSKYSSMYHNFWLICGIYILVVVIMSTIYHYTMYSDISKLLLTKLDLITAPIFGLILVCLVFIYSIFLLNKCFPIDKKYPVLFILSILYLLIGITVYAVKKYYYYGWSKKTFLKKIVYLELHTMFHYITYTGVLLMFILFLYEYEMIYTSLFNNCDQNVQIEEETKDA